MRRAKGAGIRSGAAMASIEQTDSDGVKVLRISGSLNQHGVDTIESAFVEATGSSGRVVVDLAQVDMLNTPAIAMFLGAHRMVKQQGGRLIYTALSIIALEGYYYHVPLYGYGPYVLLD